MTYRVVLWDMPSKVKALTSVNDDGSHTVMINSRLSKEQQMRCFLHEFEHIKMNHFNCFRSVDEIEKNQGGIENANEVLSKLQTIS